MAINKTVIKHNTLEGFLKTARCKELPGLFLIFGESFLIQQALKTLKDFLLGKVHDPFAVDTLEGGSTSMGDLIEQVSTLSFLSPKKIVQVNRMPLFSTQKGGADINYSLSELDHFAGFVETGIPENHWLIVTVTTVDKRKKIYKAIEKNGTLIDCSVPLGARKADLDEQAGLLRSIASEKLSKVGKTLDNQAFFALKDLTGFDLDLFSQNLEKLVAYTGKNTGIGMADVQSVIVRDKKDPIFNLTNAFMEKDLKSCLFYLNSLFNEGYHPLQILKSFENLVRKLILVKCFTQRFCQKNPINLKAVNFNAFKQSILPQIVAHDDRTKLALQEQDNALSGEEARKKKSSPPASDLLLAPNPKNPYPVFQSIQKSDNFSLAALNQALFFLADLDYGLKSSSLDAKTKMESFIINYCK